ncbi:MAG: AAA family ATPase, partial [Myxococcota bacterium]
TWRLPPTASRPLRLMGAGLGLFGTRPVPLVDRADERDTLWKALSDVHHEQRARVVLVRGPAGVGRTRLVGWIADRAHEVGGATVLKTWFTGPDTALEQIRRSLVRLLRSNPLSPALRDQRFGELFSGMKLQQLAVADAIEILLDPESRDGRLELADPQRHALLRRIWEILSLDRPLLVVFDDAQWGPDALKLARHLLDAQDRRPSRVLVLLTVPDDVLDGHTEVARLADTLARRRGAQVIALRRFDGPHRVELVQELLGFDTALAHQVADRTAGDPLFASQLVGDWVERGRLEAGPTGFVLADAGERVPATLAEVWAARIRTLVAGLEPPALELLERAAILGRDVDVLEWQAVCDDPEGRHASAGRAYLIPRHARLRQALMDRLLANRLAEPTDRGFVFTHGLFRDALVARAVAAGRYRMHTTAAAAVLVHRLAEPGVDAGGDPERIGLLLADAGRTVPALDALFRAETFRRRTAGVAAALDLLAAVERVLDTSKLPRKHRGWAELAARRASAFAALGRMVDAEAAARTAHQRAVAGGWEDLQALAATVLGAVAHAHRDELGAEAHWLEAVGLLGEDGDAAATVRVWHRLRRIAVDRGELGLAHTRGEAIRTALARATDDAARAVGLGALAEHLWTEHRLDEADAAATEAASLASR